MTKRSIRLIAVPVAAIALFAAACGNDSDSGGSASTTDEAGPELTGPPVKLMVTGSFDAFGSDYSQVPEAAQAAASAIEADGGLNGSPFEFIVCNQADENDASDCARQAVDEDVVATIGTFTSFGATMNPILTEAGIPQIAVYPIDFSDYTAEVNYPLFGGTIATTGGMGAQLADDGAETINISYLDIEQGALAADLVKIGTDPRGAEVISQTPVPGDVVEFSPQVAAATEDDPDGIAVLLTNEDAPGYLRALNQAGYDGKIATATSSLTPAQLQELGDISEGLLIPSAFKPSTLTDDPAVQQFNDEMEQYAPDATRDDSAENSWAGVHLLAMLMEGKGKVTAASITNALNTSGDIDLGLIPPINFKQGTEIPALAPGVEIRIYNTSVMYTVVENGELVATTGKFVNVLE
jgi:ABC-type branched-subunit amino acid transport system substrate-binding protein